MKFVNYDVTTNEIMGYYDDSIHKVIPTPNFEITDTEHAAALSICANMVDAGALVYTPPTLTLAEAQALKIAECKVEACRRICDILPEWKQRNLTARAVQLVRIAAPSTAEIAEMDAIEAAFDTSIVPIRVASDVIEAEINAKLKAETTMAIDIQNHAAWPV